MRVENEYLSEESLEQLIALVEHQELVAAPPDLKESILGRVKQEPQIRRNNKEEFRRYCIRVWTSVAAAVLLVFTLPTVSEQAAQRPTGKSILAEVFGGNLIFGKEDVFHFFDHGGR